MSKDQISPHKGAIYRLDAPIVSRRDGVLCADDFDDLYFDAHDGLAESKHVFINGTNLRGKLRDSNHLTIAETGFGTGLNFLATWKAWRETQPKTSKLRFYTIEAFPLTAKQITDSLKYFTELETYLSCFCSVYSKPTTDRYNFLFDEGGVEITICIEDINIALPKLNILADVWFLDGFSPAKNPTMWTPVLFNEMKRLSGKGTSYATFTSASMVQKGLRENGFKIKKQPGFGKKREMLSGVYCP